MSVRAMVWGLLSALTVLESWAAIPSKRQTLPNIENGWPLTDKDVGEGGDFVIQMPSCLAVEGVCALRQNCQEEYIHETSDLCGEQADTVCCLTRSTFEKHVLQLKSCADTGSVCAFEEDCPEDDRHSNPLLCGDQLGVTCCKTLPSNIPDPHPRRAHDVQIFSCEVHGGICRQEEQCPEADRLGNSDMCGDQPFITCCQASDTNSSTLSFEVSKKRFEDKKAFDLKYKRKAHSVQIKSCEALGGICRQKDQCETEDRMGNSDTCGDQPSITCCQSTNLDRPSPYKRTPQQNEKRRAHSVQIKSCEALGGICRQKDQCPKDSRLGTFDSCGDNPLIACCQLQSKPNEISSEKRSPEQFPSFLQKKSANIGPQRPTYLPATLCESKGGSCRQESQCLEQDRLGSSDMCADEPKVICCSEDRKKRRAHSVQIESCIAQGGSCIQKDQCPKDSRLETFDSCGDNPLIACCQLQSKPNEISAEKRSPEQFPSFLQKKSANNGPQRPIHLPATLCESKGGSCKLESHCPEQDILGSSDMCADEPNVICCIFSSRDPNSIEERKKRRAHSIQLDSCRAQSGMCTYVTNCPAEEQLGEAMCGDLANITCCHLPFLESAQLHNKQSADVVSVERASKIGSDGKEKRGAAIPIQMKTCKAQGGVCKKKIECHEEDYIDASDICGNPYELINTCCRISNTLITKRRAHSVTLESCRAQGGMCRQTDQCPETDRLGSDSCGNLPYITCCKKSDEALSSGAEPRMIGNPSLNLECLMRGGLCKRNVDCFPEDRYENTELCGSQDGVSCCKRLPPRVGECSERGGECVPEAVCQNGPKDKFGQCSGGDVCCIWMK